MIRGEVWLQIRLLREKGMSISDIARELGIDRKTVRRYLASGEPPRPGPRSERSSKLDPHKDYLRRRIEQGCVNCEVLMRELRQRGYTGGMTILREFVHPLRPARRIRATERFETGPGEQAQVDWAFWGRKRIEGVWRPLWTFVYTLCYSRLLFAEFVTRTDEATLLRCHCHAFEATGGVPREILYDNMKTVSLGRMADDRPIWNPRLIDFAGHHGFQPRLCQVGRPQTKGKVERPVDYLKNNFGASVRLLEAEDVTLSLLGQELNRWLAEVANVRVHGTTRQRPIDRWEEERPHLQPLSRVKPFDLSRWDERIVTVDAWVIYETNLYSVPAELVGQPVRVRQTVDGFIEIYRHQELVARHSQRTGRYERSLTPDHHAGLKALRRSRAPTASEPTDHRQNVQQPSTPPVQERELSVYEAVAAEEAGAYDDRA